MTPENKNPLTQFEPRKTVWETIAEKAFGTGLVHGSKAVYAAAKGYNWSPSDACDVLATMVEDGVLKPCKLDMAGADFSVRAFRTIGPSSGAGTENANAWDRASAHLWSYTPVRNTP